MSKLIEDIDRSVWRDTTIEKPWYQRWPVLGARLLVAVARDIEDGSLSLRATSLVYTTLLSLVPLLAICFSVIKGFSREDQIEPFLRSMLAPLGPQGDDIIPRIMEFVAKINVSVLGTLGVMLLVFSVLSLMQKIESAFNQIWNVSNSRPLILRIRDYMSVLLVGPLFIFLSMGMTASLKYPEFMAGWIDAAVFNSAMETAFRVLPFVLFTLAFTAIYMFIPNTKVKVLPALLAGVVTAVMWKILGFLFGAFVAGSGNYAAIYSAFAALILFMIWLYLAWLIVLVGASITYYLQNPTNQRISRNFRQLSLRVKIKMALLLVSDIGRVFYEKEGRPLDLPMLARRMRMPARALENVVTALTRAGILAETEDGFIPGRPFEDTTVYDMLLALFAANEDEGISYADLKSQEATDRIMAHEDAAMKKAVGHLTLKQLSLGEVPA